jgi:membrane protein YqaA with SNARE-associated domain
MKKRVNPYRVVAVIVFILALALFLYSLINYTILEEKISNTIRAYGTISIFVFSFILDFVPQYISPHILLVTANFLDMNMFLSISIVIVSSTLGSLAGFGIGSKLKESKLLVDFIGKKRFKKFETGINQKGKYLVSLAAVSPVPYVPLILGMLHMKRRNFVLYGIVPRVLGFIIVGLLTYGIFI